jgi:hypothetical protein
VKALRNSGLLVACLLGGVALSTIVTMIAWGIRIEDSAFHCTDIGFGSYWTDMDLHKSAGDTVSSGWTWKKLKAVRMQYIGAFYLLWAVSTAIACFILSKKQRPNQQGRANARQPSRSEAVIAPGAAAPGGSP